MADIFKGGQGVIYKCGQEHSKNEMVILTRVWLSQLQVIELNSTNYFHTVFSHIFSYLLCSMECVRCLQSNGCRDMYSEHDGFKQHAFHAQSMLRSWMISDTNAQ